MRERTHRSSLSQDRGVVRQGEGIVGSFVDKMIRRSMKRTFRGIYWTPPREKIIGPAILVPNHHGWHDGYVMYHVVCALGLPCVSWSEEYDESPLFRHVGAMPFPAADPLGRAVTIRKTIRFMREQKSSLALFAEGELHRPPTLRDFGRGIELIAAAVPGVKVIPVAMRYELSMHERPECHVVFGDAVTLGPSLAYRTRLAVQGLLNECELRVRFNPDTFELLAKGTPDSNERKGKPK